MTRSELKQLIREVIEEANGKYWDVDEPLRDSGFNIIVGDAIPKKEWFTSYVNHIYYNKEEDFLRLDGHYETMDKQEKGKFAIFVRGFMKGGTRIDAETLGDTKGHWGGDLKDTTSGTAKHSLYLSDKAKRVLKYIREVIKAEKYDELASGIHQVSSM
jgi:hypothetical protein